MKLKSVKRKTLACICTLSLAGALTVAGQQPGTDAALKKKYSNDAAVFLSRSENVEVKMEKGLPVIYNKVSEDLLLLSDKTSAYSERNIYWSDFSEISDIDARSIVPSGKKFKTIKVKDIIRSNEIADGNFFDDSRAYKLDFPGLAAGSRATLSYTEKIYDPHLYGRFFFNTYAPAEDVEYSVTIPSEVKIRYKLFNVKDSSIQFSSKTSGKKTTYLWKLKDAKKVKPEDGAPGLSYYVPNIVVLIDSYTSEGKTHEVLPDVASLYEWYYNLMKNVNSSVTPPVKKLADSITAGAGDSLGKVKKIFEWVENNINYIAYEDSLAGLIPREASLVIARRFGDCKDMATTLTQLIRAAGLPAYPAWLGTRDISYTFTDVPSPLAANHMICVYIQDGKYYFLDATGKDAPFGYPTSMIQGKQAIIGLGEGNFSLVTVPETPMQSNALIDTTRIWLLASPHRSGEPALTHVKGLGVAYAGGYNKILIVERLRNADLKERKDFVSSLLQKGNNKFYIDSLSFGNMNESADELTIRYGFGLDDYAENNGNKLYVNMNLEKEYADDQIEKDREAPVSEEFKNVLRHVIRLTIPAGYKVSYLPGDCAFSNPSFGFSIHYSVHGEVVTEEQMFFVDTLMIGQSEFGGWNKMITQITKAYSETVTLEKE